MGYSLEDYENTISDILDAKQFHERNLLHELLVNKGKNREYIKQADAHLSLLERLLNFLNKQKETLL